jgi:hypothetical protein
LLVGDRATGSRRTLNPDVGAGGNITAASLHRREDTGGVARGVGSVPMGWWEKAGYTSTVLDQLCPNVHTTTGWDKYRRVCKAAGRLCVAAHQANSSRRGWRMTADTLTTPDDGHLPAAWPIMTDIVAALARRYRWPDDTIIGSLQHLTIPGLSNPVEGQVIGAGWHQAWSGDIDGLTRIRNLLTDTGDASRTTTRPERCLARIRLSKEVVAWLDQRPRAGHEVQPYPSCDLEIGHPGPHAAMGQQCSDAEWWVRWTLDPAFRVIPAV